MQAPSRARAAYAADPAQSRGRMHAEPSSRTRTDFRRDCDRIIHSTAFRRLAHKTQVFIYHEGDHYRTRLTHTLEVTQIARSLARALVLDEDLAEASALAHDLGHPPFGHAGERALDACLSGHGGFDHNAQTLAVVTDLERRYAEFDGLNLTWETLEGLVKHNGPLTDRSGRAIGRYSKAGISAVISDYSARHDLQLDHFPSAEAQVAAIADDIAYDAHDIDDGLRAGLFTLDELSAVTFIQGIIREVDGAYPRLDEVRRAHEVVRRIITRMIEDVILESEQRIRRLAPANVDDIRKSATAVAGFSAAMLATDRAIKDFLKPKMYQHPRVSRIMSQAEDVLRNLFDAYSRRPEVLPSERLHDLGADAPQRLRQIANFIAGMTDRYALDEHARIFDSTPELR
ncbi:MAG: deoxyguanosinetriphosphate triphosphohydrolase [Xanthobacteraceae bacterium]